MTTDVVDGAFHLSAFPAGYVGPGTRIGNVKSALNGDGHMFLNITSAGNAIQINCGFPPRKVKVINSTDGLIWEWQYGMPAANSIKNLLGGSPTATQDTASQILITGDLGAGRAQGQDGNIGYVTLGATLAGTAKNLCVELVG